MELARGLLTCATKSESQRREKRGQNYLGSLFMKKPKIDKGIKGQKEDSLSKWKI